MSEPKQRHKDQEFKSILRLCSEFEVSLGYKRPCHKHIMWAHIAVMLERVCIFVRVSSYFMTSITRQK